MKQRFQDYHAGTIDAHRVKQLESLPGFSWNAKADAWQTSYTALHTWLTQHDGAYPKRDAQD